MHCVIFTGGDFIPSEYSTQLLKGTDLILAADSGADSAIKLGVVPNYILGDLDSISKKTREAFEKMNVPFFVSPTNKDETDTELAVNFAIEKGATNITLFGGISGNRFDHIIANLLLPISFSVPVKFVNGNQISFIEKGKTHISLSGSIGDTLSLIPLSGNIEHITTSGLQYPLNDSVLEFGRARGISNVFTAQKAVVSFTKGILLFVHTMS